MKLRSNRAWVAWLLMVGVLLHGLPHALAQPMAVNAPPAVAAGESSCHDHAAVTTPAHDQGACKIACELGAAPALMIVPIVQVRAARPVRVPTVHPLALADAVPPDHPPPI